MCTTKKTQNIDFKAEIATFMNIMTSFQGIPRVLVSPPGTEVPCLVPGVTKKILQMSQKKRHIKNSTTNGTAPSAFPMSFLTF